MRKCFGGLIAVAIAVCLATSAFAQEYQVSPSDKTITSAVQTVMDPTPDDHSPVDPSAVNSVISAGGCGGCQGTAGVWSSGCGDCCGAANNCCPQRRILARRTNRCCTPVNTCCAAPVNHCCETACNNDCCRRVVARPVIAANRCCNVATNNCCGAATTDCCGTVACAANTCGTRVVARPMLRNNCCATNACTTGCCATTGTTTAGCCAPANVTYCSNPAPTTHVSDCGGCQTTCCDNGRFAYSQPRIILGRLGARRACR